MGEELDLVQIFFDDLERNQLIKFESCWRHRGALDWIFHYQRQRDNLVSPQVEPLIRSFMTPFNYCFKVGQFPQHQKDNSGLTLWQQINLQGLG